MIFYFSGTGNSKYVAESLSELIQDSLEFIPDVTWKRDFDNRDMGIVFPVYSWGVPTIVLNFIKSIPSIIRDKMKSENKKIWCVMTCGDEVALAPEMFLQCLKDCDIEALSIWSVTMPNNYVLLPGFDVDKNSIEDEKLALCKKRIENVSQGILSRSETIDVVRGGMPWIKTKIVYPLFKKWGIFTSKWHYTDKCISCGKCEEICPLHNISMKEKHPEWNENCCSCLGCYHICPTHAVAYGKETKKKGQYFLFSKREGDSIIFRKIS